MIVTSITQYHLKDKSNPLCPKPYANPKASAKARNTPKITVYFLKVCCPTSPLLCSFSNGRITMVRSCRMMDAVIYGVIESIVIDKLLSPLPDKQSSCCVLLK